MNTQVCININTGLKFCTYHDTVIDIILGTNTPTNTTRRNSDTRTSIHINMKATTGTTKLKSNTNTNIPANTNHHVRTNIN